jgi:hypothetical protein
MIRLDRPFLARQLARKVATLDTSWDGFANRLGCATSELNALACCRAPRAECFDADVLELVAYTGIPEPSLRQLFSEITAAQANVGGSRGDGT